MPTAATALYFRKTSSTPTSTTTAVETATLTDNDLIRGDDAGEFAQRPNGSHVFDGFTRFVANGPTLGDISQVFDDGEILATVTFSDGTTLTGVQGLLDSVTGSYGFSEQYFLLDQAALAAAGKTFGDVVDVTTEGFTDHNLTWAELGFSGAPAPIPPPPPPPPAPNLILGTSGNDVLIGTAGDDLIVGNGGNPDRLTGGGGADTFVFGAEVGNGVRDRAVITDFDVYEDVLLVTDSAQVSRISTNSKGQVVVQFAGADGDRVILENIDDTGPQVRIQFDPDFII
jgi:hypothetical protein